MTANVPPSPQAGEEDDRTERSPGHRVPRTDLWISLLILLATFAAYSSVVHLGFVAYDDRVYVVENLHLRDGLAVRNLHWIFLSFSPDNWFPVTRLSLILDYRLFGLAAGWYHAENVVIHAMAAVLLFGFLRRATQVRWPCAFVALVFALHPLHVESVAWVAERKDVLCAFFWFATFWAWLRYTEKPTKGRYVSALIWFCLGLMAKPMIVTLPFLLLLLDVWPLRRAFSRKLIWEKLPFAALSGAVIWITMRAQQAALTDPGPSGLRAENALTSIAAYIADTFWPARLWAVHAYPVSLPAWQAVAAAVVLAVISVFVLRQLPRRPFLATGWFWFLLTLAPVIGLVQAGWQSRADRYMYVPMVGLSVMIAWGFAGLVARWPAIRRWTAGLAITACLSMAAVTWTQTQYWQSTDELFQHAIRMDARNYLAWNYLGRALMVSGRFPSEAVSCFRNALEIRPDFAETHDNLGLVFFSKQNRVEDAIAEYREALRLNPGLTIAHVHLASALLRLGQPLEARNEYEIVLSQNPAYFFAAHIALGILLANGGDLAEGVTHLQEAVRLEPDDKAAQVLLGQMLMDTPGHLPDSILHFGAALRIDPRDAEAHRALAAALLRLPGRREEAIAHLETAQRIAPDPKLAAQLDQLKAGGVSGHK